MARAQTSRFARPMPLQRSFQASVGTSNNIGVLRCDYGPLARPLHQHLDHDPITRFAWSAVGILISDHSPAHMCDGDFGGKEFDLGCCDCPHTVLELHAVGPCLQLLELFTAIQQLSCHVDEPNVL